MFSEHSSPHVDTKFLEKKNILGELFLKLFTQRWSIIFLFIREKENNQHGFKQALDQALYLILNFYNYSGCRDFIQIHSVVGVIIIAKCYWSVVMCHALCQGPIFSQVLFWASTLIIPALYLKTLRLKVEVLSVYFCLLFTHVEKIFLFSKIIKPFLPLLSGTINTENTVFNKWTLLLQERGVGRVSLIH